MVTFVGEIQHCRNGCCYYLLPFLLVKICIHVKEREMCIYIYNNLIYVQKDRKRGSPMCDVILKYPKSFLLKHLCVKDTHNSCLVSYKR